MKRSHVHLVAALSTCALACAMQTTKTALRSNDANALAVERQAAPIVEFALVEKASGASTTSREHEGKRVELGELRRFRFATASPSQDHNGYPAVAFEVDPRDATEFQRWTGANIDRQLAILIDGDITTLGVINDALPGDGIISRRDPWSAAQARDLAARIHAGGTAAPKTIDPATPFALAAPYEPTDGAEFSITLERTPCFGRCPAYTVTVNGDGNLRYDGKSNVKQLGEATRSVSVERVRGLLARFAAADFLALRDEYKMPVTDLPSTILTLRVNGREKRVVNYWARGAEDVPDVAVHQMLDVLADAVDRAAWTDRWVK